MGDDYPSNEVIYEKLNTIENKLDILLNRHNSEICSTHVEGGSMIRLRKPMDFKRIEDLRALKNFEKKLNDEKFMTDTLNEVSVFFGDVTKYKKSPRIFAYKVIDLLTKRKLYSRFSWTGKKKRNGEKNNCLEKHTVFIDFILSAIHLKIPEFELCELEDIFQILCRNKNTKTDDTSSED